MAKSTLTGGAKPKDKQGEAAADDAAKLAKAAAEAEVEAKAKAEAEAKAKAEAEAKAKAEAEAKAKAKKDTVAEGRSIITKRGIVGPGEVVTAKDLKGGAAAHSRLKAKGFIL